MKNILKTTLNLTIICFLLTISGCEKDLYEQPIKQKERPNISVEMKEVSKTPELMSKLRNQFPAKFTNSLNAKGGEQLLNLEGNFGKVRLDNVLEIKESNQEKSYSFEIEETIKKPNEYLNLVIDKNNIVWLYKIEKLVQKYKDFPINTERLVRQKMNTDFTLLPSTPCDSIEYPPFYPDPVVNTGGAGPIAGVPNTPFPGNGNWQGGSIPGGGFFPPVVPPTPGGESSGGGIGDVIAFVSESVVGAWNWWVHLFHSNPSTQAAGCQCPNHNKMSNVVIVDLPTTPCNDGGFIGFIPQSPLLDKIYKLDELLFYQLGYDNKMYLYQGGGDIYLDYFLDLSQNIPVGYDDYNNTPDLVKYLRITGDFTGVQQIIETIINNPNLYPSAKPLIFLHGLTSDQQTVYNNNSELNQYLINKEWSDESQNFVKELINASIILNLDAMSVWNNEYDNFVGQMSISEKAIFDNLLPNRKLWYICSAKKAFDKANELYPTTTHNGKGDAFRHALWNGYCALTLAGNLGEQLTTAHETKPNEIPGYNFNDKETQMDLFNNDKGRQIALFSNLTNIETNVLEYLNNGYLKYLNNLDDFVDANGVVHTNLATVFSVLIPTDQ